MKKFNVVVNEEWLKKLEAVCDLALKKDGINAYDLVINVLNLKLEEIKEVADNE